MSISNTFIDDRYSVHATRLAVGVEPRSSLTGLRISSGIEVRLERYGRPLDSWRNWRPGQTLTEYLPALPHHSSGRFAAWYDRKTKTDIELRIVHTDPVTRRVGQGRGIVPRRARFTILDESSVKAIDDDRTTPSHPVWRRAFPFWCFPGAASPIGSGATVIRGSIVRPDADGVFKPVRWARVRARTDDGEVVGWAHGDDRGEFVLVVGAIDRAIDPDPLSVTLTVGRENPPPAPPADKRLAAVDPLWDLPVEALTLSSDPYNEASLTGERFLPSHSLTSSLGRAQPIEIPLGRETSVAIQIA